MPTQYNFTRAGPEEPVIYGACRPRHRHAPPETTVQDWIEFTQEQGIERVCCLLDDKLERYDGLLTEYRESFGADSVCHAPVSDFTLIEKDRFYGQVLPFLRSADADDAQTVVHCSAGSGRTGHILVGWLVRERGYSLDGAIKVVEQMGRNPREAGPQEALRELFVSPSASRASLGCPPKFTGDPAAPGLTSGSAMHLTPSDVSASSDTQSHVDHAAFEDAILVTPEVTPSMVGIIERVGGLVIYDNEMSLTAAGAVLGREKETPTVINCDSAITELDDGVSITVDATYGNIYPISDC